MNTDLEIAHGVALRPIAEVAAALGVPEDALEPYGRHKAKVRPALVDADRGGALVLVTGMSPTPAGEGKTTTSIGLVDALAAAGERTVACLREPSLGPCFGLKGGAAGGGWAQVVPMEDINLHFTGDFHAITAAHNLLAALVDNHLHRGSPSGLDPRRTTWRRVTDTNDRALRQVVVGLGAINGPVRETGFDITAASEVMAVLCLAADLADLQARLARIVVGARRDGSLVTAGDLGADGAMAVLLKDAIAPNLVQTLEGTPALVHGGPFGNIAHGCSSLAATRLGLRLADVVVTEAGFGADLGAEKFLDIKARVGGLRPACAVVVATVRAIKMQGGVALVDLDREDVGAVERGAANLLRHVANVRAYALPVVVALNRFTSDTEAEIAAVRSALGATPMAVCTHWSDGGAGAADLAALVQGLVREGAPDLVLLYPDDMPLAEKMRTIAQRTYGAADIALAPAAARALEAWEAAGFGHLPVCMAKTQYSFTADPARLGAPSGHVLPIREVRLSAGAGFVVAVCGEVLTMPGLPAHPAAEVIGLDAEGNVVGLS